MEAFINLAVTVVLAIIGWFVLVWLAGVVGIPATIVKLVGLLIFLYVAWQVVKLIQSRNK